MPSDLSPAVKAAAGALSRVATAAGFRLREQRHILARAVANVARVAVEAALPSIEADVRNAVAAELAASTLTTSTPLSEYRAQVRCDLLRELAAELRAGRATGGIEYVDADWLEARAADIERTQGLTPAPRCAATYGRMRCEHSDGHAGRHHADLGGVSATW